MRKRNILMAAGFLSATAALADVTVTFTNEVPTQTKSGDITLNFSVDGVGNVTLFDAYAALPDTAVSNAVNAWEGPVGTVSHADAFNTTFSIIMTGTGDALRLTGQGNQGGIGTQGNNQNKITQPGIEEVYATPTFDGYLAALDVKSMEWTSANGGDAQGQKARIDTATAIYNYPVDMSLDGSWDLTGSNVYVNVGESLTFGNDHSITNAGSGYTLAGFTFDLKAFVGTPTLKTTFTETPGDVDQDPTLITNVFTVSADGTATTTTYATNGLPTEGFFDGATGSFDWEWVPVDLFDENSFTGRVGSGWKYQSGSDTLGPLTISDDTINLVAGEAAIMTFDLSGLTNAPGKYLRLDNLHLQNNNGAGDVSFYDASEDTYRQLTGDGPGQYPVVADEFAVQTLNVIVEEGDKIALWRPSGSGQVRLRGFQFRMVEIVTDTGIPDNVSAIGLDTAVLLDWDDDDTGVPLDYYTVYRSLSAGVTTNDNSTNVTSSTYLDLAVTNGVEYFYAITSTGTNGNESGLSAEVSATPAPASADIVMIQHLDASEATSVTTNELGEMTLWSDLTANGNDAVDGLGDPILWPSASVSGTGLAGMDVRTNRANITAFDVADTGAFLDFSEEAALNSGFSVLVAFKADYVTQDNSRNVLMGTSENLGGALNGFGLRYDRGRMAAFMNSSGIKTALVKDGLSDLPVLDGDTVVMALTYKAADGAMTFWDSKNNSATSGNTAPYGNFTGENLYLAGSGNGGQFMDGMIGEVQVFSSTLSEAELISRGEALALKWGAVEGSGFDVWAGGWGVDIGDASNDYDLDGADNLAEYALNGNPTNAADRGQFSVLAEGGVFKYIYASNAADSALTYTFIDTEDLVFQTSPGTNSYLTADQGATAGNYITVTNNYDASSDTLFIELEIGQE